VFLTKRCVVAYVFSDISQLIIKSVFFFGFWRVAVEGVPLDAECF
jgi:hypothetical protein